MQNGNKIITKKTTKNNPTTYNILKILKEKENFYIKKAQEQEQNTKKFLENRQIFNKATGEFKPLVEYSLKREYAQNYTYISSVCDYINVDAISKGLIPVFITLTLPSKFHPTKVLKNKKRVLNKNFRFDVDEYINKGYKLLQSSFRTILRKLTRDNTKNNLKTPYFRVIEMHKDMTPHLHAVVYLSKSDNNCDKIFELHDVINRLINSGQLGKQYKVEVLNNPERGAIYTLKYVEASFQIDENEDDNSNNKKQNLRGLYFLDGWKKRNKIRLVSYSRLPLNKADFIKIIGDFVNNVEPCYRVEGKYFNRYTHLANNCKYKVFENKNIDKEDISNELLNIKKILNKNEYKYLICKSVENKEELNSLVVLLNKSLQKQIFTLVDYLLNSDNPLQKQNKIKEFITTQKQNYLLAKETLSRDNLVKLLGIKKIKKFLNFYSKKISEFSLALNETKELFDEIKKADYEINHTTGNFSFRTKKQKKEFENYRKRMCELRENIKKITYKINNKLYALCDVVEEFNLYLYEKKYKLIDREIYRVTKDEIIKIFDKKDIQMVKMGKD